MGRVHRTKPGSKKRLIHDVNKMKEIVQTVIQGHMTAGEAAKHYNVPKSTVTRRVRAEKAGVKVGKMGRRPALDFATEKMLLDTVQVNCN